MGKTNIEWADETWPITRGCTRVSDGCTHCYAESMAARIVRMGKGKPTKYDGLVKLVQRDVRQFKIVNGNPTGDFRTVQRTEPRWTGVARFCPEELTTPLRMRKGRRIFVSSMSDLFHDDITNEQIAAVFGVMAVAKQHTFMVLTKRARRMREWFEWAAKHGDGYDSLRFGPSALLTCAWGASAGDSIVKEWDLPGLEDLPAPETFGTTWPLPNVQIGVTCETQAAIVERIPELLRTPAAIRWISAEPLLGPLQLFEPSTGGFRGPAVIGTPWRSAAPGEPVEYGVDYEIGIDLVIAGCESGHGARSCDVAWLRSLRDQCASAGVAFFLKQAMHRIEPGNYYKVGDDLLDVIGAGPGSHRKPGGVIGAPYLDGVQHLAFPEVAHAR